MPRGDQVARQWKIIRILLGSNTGRSVAELAEELDCRPRNIYRDIDALEVAGFPLTNRRINGKNRWYMVNPEKQRLPVPFSMMEIMALYFSRNLITPLKNTVFYDSLESLFAKIKTTLPPETVKFLDKVQRVFHVSTTHRKDYGSYRDTMDILNRAVIDHLTVKITYFTMHNRQLKQRDVDPYTIWYANDTFYLVGYCHMRKSLRVFTLERIKEISITSRHFNLPEDFSVKTLMDSSFGVFRGNPEKVKIYFSPSVSGYIMEKQWHKTQKIIPRANGSIIFEAEIAITEDFRSWIMGWGSGAMVIEPESLKEQIREEAKKMLGNYGNGEPHHQGQRITP